MDLTLFLECSAPGAGRLGICALGPPGPCAVGSGACRPVKYSKCVMEPRGFLKQLCFTLLAWSTTHSFYFMLAISNFCSFHVDTIELFVFLSLH